MTVLREQVETPLGIAWIQVSGEFSARFDRRDVTNDLPAGIKVDGARLIELSFNQAITEPDNVILELGFSGDAQLDGDEDYLGLTYREERGSFDFGGFDDFAMERRGAKLLAGSLPIPRRTPNNRLYHSILAAPQGLSLPFAVAWLSADKLTQDEMGTFEAVSTVLSTWNPSDA